MNRADFIFTIGYQGNAAIVDQQAKNRLGKLSTMELLEQGYLRAAFCSYLYESDSGKEQEFLNAFNRKAGTTYSSTSEVKRLFGVYGVPDNVARVTSL